MCQRVETIHLTALRTEAGLLATLLHIYKHSGIRGAYTGYVAQLMRECPGNVVYFGSYSASRSLMADRMNETCVAGPIPVRA